jgi:hypothetical protein
MKNYAKLAKSDARTPTGPRRAQTRILLAQPARIRQNKRCLGPTLEKTDLAFHHLWRTRFFRIRQLVRTSDEERLLRKRVLPLVCLVAVCCQHRLDQVAVVAYDSHSAISDGVGRSGMVRVLLHVPGRDQRFKVLFQDYPGSVAPVHDLRRFGAPFRRDPQDIHPDLERRPPR